MRLRKAQRIIISLRRAHIVIAKELSKCLKVRLAHCLVKLHVTDVADLLFITPKPISHANGWRRILIERPIGQLHIAFLVFILLQRDLHLGLCLVETRRDQVGLQVKGRVFLNPMDSFHGALGLVVLYFGSLNLVYRLVLLEES